MPSSDRSGLINECLAFTDCTDLQAADRWRCRLRKVACISDDAIIVAVDVHAGDDLGR